MLIANTTEARDDQATRPKRLFPMVGFGVVLLFLLAPWPFPDKVHAALHGLCAQRPSHSLSLGSHFLPLDARMTGIYGGFLVACCYLAARRRFRAAQLPPPATVIALGCFVGLMAVDGGNSLLVDLGVWHPYEPDNRVRLATGLLTGISLAVALCFLVAMTLWREPASGQPPVGGPAELLALAVLQVPFALAALSGIPVLYGPVAMLLLIAATAIITALMQLVIVLAGHRDRTYGSFRQLHASASMALLAAVGVMGTCAAGRYLLERLSGAPPLT